VWRSKGSSALATWVFTRVPTFCALAAQGSCDRHHLFNLSPNLAFAKCDQRFISQDAEVR
jgi:hypothetical protein